MSKGQATENQSVKPLSLRLSFEQRKVLEKEADGLPVSTYIKIRLFGSQRGERDTRIPRPLKDKQALAQLLGRLGQPGIATNLQDLSDAAASGSLIIDNGTTQALHTALQDIRNIRDHLIAALGLRS